MPETERDAPGRFADWLEEHRQGMLDVEIAEAIREVIAGVIRTDKKGSVTIKLTFSTASDMIAVIDEVTKSVPEVREAKLYWPSLDGTLTRDHPSQPQLLPVHGHDDEGNDPE